MHSETEKLQAVAWLLLPIGTLLEQLFSSLQPELHGFQWIACLSGALFGQWLFPADTVKRGIGGFGFGYMAGLYGGVNFAAFAWNVDPQLGRFALAFLVDLVARLVWYVFQNPSAAADFFNDRILKIATTISSDVFSKAAGWLDSLLKKKQP